MLIVGSGAVATMLAERVFDAGVRFQVFGTPSERLRSLDARFPGCSVSDPAKVALHDCWIVAVKAGQNREKVRALSVAPSPSRILVLQNGFRPDADWKDLACRVDRGLSTYGVKSRAPGFITGGERGCITVSEGSPFAALLRGLGFLVAEEPDLSPAIWRKLSVNASLNVVAALYDVCNGETLEISEAREMVRAAALEVEQIARAGGVEFGPRSGWEVTRDVATLTAGNVCSTLADVRSGRRTEYDQINGEILAAAEKWGVPAPTLRFLDLEFRKLGTTMEAA